MRIHLMLLSIVTALIAAPAMAADTVSKKESIGVGLGAAVGAAAGGPVGLILGAALGAKVGDEFTNKDTEIAGVEANLRGSNAKVTALVGEIADLNRDIDTLGADIEHLQSVARPELLALMQAGIEMDLLFRTDEHSLADSSHGRLGQLATSLATMPEVYVRLDGFADERGDAQYNQALSEKRVQYVKRLLVSKGVPESRISHIAHGESPAADSTIDSYALERKVSLTLYVDDANAFAATP